MSLSDSELIMSKRKRELKSLIIILRGVPGSGKTTTARTLDQMFTREYYRTVHLSRDCLRMRYCTQHNMDYQGSFRNSTINTTIRDEYFQKMFDYLWDIKDEPYCCFIIDATNTKVADLKRTFWTIKRALIGGTVCFDKYIYTKRREYRSIHDVPECIMQRFRDELKESDEWLKKHSDEFKIKCFNKICV